MGGGLAYRDREDDRNGPIQRARDAALGVFGSERTLQGRPSTSWAAYHIVDHVFPPGQQAFDEGIDAYCYRLPRSACPYPPDTAEYREWVRGWDEAEKIDRDGKERFILPPRRLS